MKILFSIFFLALSCTNSEVLEKEIKVPSQKASLKRSVEPLEKEAKTPKRKENEKTTLITSTFKLFDFDDESARWRKVNIADRYRLVWASKSELSELRKAKLVSGKIVLGNRLVWLDHNVNPLPAPAPHLVIHLSRKSLSDSKTRKRLKAYPDLGLDLVEEVLTQKAVKNINALENISALDLEAVVADSNAIESLKLPLLRFLDLSASALVFSNLSYVFPKLSYLDMRRSDRSEFVLSSVDFANYPHLHTLLVDSLGPAFSEVKDLRGLRRLDIRTNPNHKIDTSGWEQLSTLRHLMELNVNLNEDADGLQLFIKMKNLLSLDIGRSSAWKGNLPKSLKVMNARSIDPSDSSIQVLSARRSTYRRDARFLSDYPSKAERDKMADKAEDEDEEKNDDSDAKLAELKDLEEEVVEELEESVDSSIRKAKSTHTLLLDLSGKELSNTQWKNIMGLKKLKKLHISGYEFSSGQIEQLSTLKNLKTLNLIGSELPSVDAFYAMPHLKEFHTGRFMSSGCTSAWIESMSSFRGNNTIVYQEESDNGFEDDFDKKLLSKITRIRIAYNVSLDREFADKLKSLSRLREIRLSVKEPPDAEVFSKLIALKKKLFFYDLNIDSKPFFRWKQAKVKNLTLRFESGLPSVAQWRAIERAGVETLKIHTQKITERDILRLVKPFRVLKKIYIQSEDSDIKFVWTSPEARLNIINEGKMDWSKILRSKNIRALSVSGQPKLFALFPSLTHLEHLKLRGVEEIAKLTNLKKLKTLVIQTDTLTQDLAFQISQLSRLESLTFNGRFSENLTKNREGWKMLQTLPKLHKLELPDSIYSVELLEAINELPHLNYLAADDTPWYLNKFKKLNRILHPYGKWTDEWLEEQTEENDNISGYLIGSFCKGWDCVETLDQNTSDGCSAGDEYLQNEYEQDHSQLHLFLNQPL